jgi:hypothetical protein
LNHRNELLQNGTLTFLVSIKPNQEYYCKPKQQQPVLGHNRFTKLVDDKEITDIAFKVVSEVFHAHKLILKVEAPELYELAIQFDKDTPMPIQNVEPKSFELMLKYVYGKTILPNEWAEHSKQILEASGKYGFAAIKVEAEAWRIKKLELTVDNAVDELLYADDTLCVGLKKSCYGLDC